MNVTYEDVRKSEEIRTYIKQADESLKAIGYTEHSFAHCTKVAKVAGDLLEKLGYDAHEVELARIAGFMHDIGNVVNRIDHAQRVNYAAEKSDVIFEPDSKTITLDLKINTEICAVMDYFEIFTGRMLLCRKAAEFLGLQFKLDINDVYLL